MIDPRKGYQRFVGDRFRRIWGVVEYVAAKPGISRADLARHFCLSERQVQADLNIIRADMGLPLIREGGYRFEADRNRGAALTDRDLLLLTQVLGRAMRQPMVEPGPIRELAMRMAEAFPPHLHPLARLLLGNLGHPHRQVSETLLAAIREGIVVRLHHPPGVIKPGWREDTPTVRPERLILYGHDWYLLAADADGRARMLPLATIASVSFVNRADWPAALRSAS